MPVVSGDNAVLDFGVTSCSKLDAVVFIVFDAAFQDGGAAVVAIYSRGMV